MNTVILLLSAVWLGAQAVMPDSDVSSDDICTADCSLAVSNPICALIYGDPVQVTYTNVCTLTQASCDESKEIEPLHFGQCNNIETPSQVYQPFDCASPLNQQVCVTDVQGNSSYRDLCSVMLANCQSPDVFRVAPYC